MDFDFLPSNLQIAYPFQDNVIVERYGVDTYVAPAVAAAQIRTVDQRDDELLMEWAYLETTDDFATLDEANIKLKWKLTGDLIELNLSAGTCTAVVQAYGSWVVVEWWGPEELSGTLTAVIKMVFPTTAIEDTGPYKVIEVTEKSDELPFHSSLIKQGPNEVRRAYWKRGDTLELVADRGEELIIRPGFNMSIEQVAETTTGFQAQQFTIVEGRPETRVAINAVPGAGLGQYLLCPGSLYLLKLSGVGPNEQGDVQLRPIDCYWLERELEAVAAADGEHGIVANSTLKPNEVRIKNGCGPCCSCEAYIDTYTHLRDIWDRAAVASGEIYTLRDQVQALATTYEDVQQGSIPDTVTLDLNEDQDELIVVLSYVNQTDEVKNPADLWASDPLTFEGTLTSDEDGLTFAYKANTGKAVNGRASVDIEGEDTDDGFKVAINELAVQARTVMYWIGKFEMTPAPESGTEITSTAILSGGGVTTSESGSDTITVG